ncbi:UNVERIFIED_CONTAM: oxygen-independent coproporphyrinogen-3 oxidase [Acetivibrio alkalicellulosi]
MIFVELKGHDFLYQVKDIISLFFEDTVVEYIVDSSNGIFIFSELKKNLVTNDSVKLYQIETSISNNGILCHHKVKNFELSKNLDNVEEKKALKREVKRELYVSLSVYTKSTVPWGFLTGIRPAKIVHKMLNEGLNCKEISSKLENYYLLAKEKANLLLNVANIEKEIVNNTNSNMISIYIGIPFCKTRCLYCSFTSNSIDKYKDLVSDYLKAVKYEISEVSKIILSKGYEIQNIYIGGGTPTSIDAHYLAELLESIEKNFNLNGIKEYTLEAGRPDSITKEKLCIIKNSKVNRISINPQTMNDKTLEIIGRKHTSKDIINSYALAREIGFNNINMDVIVGLPNENIIDFNTTMDKIKSLNPESLTVHTLAVKRASMLIEKKNTVKFISNKEASLMINMAGEYAKEMGMHPYYLYRQKNMTGNLENIGYCKKGFESTYNIQIMEEKQTIIALGAGGITKVVYPDKNFIQRAFNVKSIELYIQGIDEMLERKKSILL